jgi:hypothetical protein
MMSRASSLLAMTLPPTLPPWLKPQTIVLHQPSGVLFFVQRVQRQRDSGEIWLLDCIEDEVEPDEANVRYALSECTPAVIEDLKPNCIIYRNGRGNIIANPKRQIAPLGEGLGLGLCPVYLAAISFAKAFGGEIINS